MAVAGDELDAELLDVVAAQPAVPGRVDGEAVAAEHDGVAAVDVAAAAGLGVAVVDAARVQRRLPLRHAGADRGQVQAHVDHLVVSVLVRGDAGVGPFDSFAILREYAVPERERAPVEDQRQAVAQALRDSLRETQDQASRHVCAQ